MTRIWASDYGSLTSDELTEFVAIIDFSKYVTPASGQYIYMKYRKNLILIHFMG